MKSHSFATISAGSSVAINATADTSARGILRPSVPLSRKPAKGRIGMSQSRVSFIVYAGSLVLHKVHLIDIQGHACAEQRNDDGKAHSGLSRRHHHHEKDKDLAVDPVPHMRERNE